MTFQNMVKTLNEFWGEKGCIVGQPYGVEVGAGTANPNTFFRVMGPEPYNVAYIEPSRRPTDGRYGESPNRLQHYFQYQVILKPAPKFNQELFIESLIALGIDPKRHDIRFVEDNWESAPLGAWGLGWEVWCDGMEVAQYTYFQQMAGSPMEIPVLEITYGLERLAMYMQDVDDYKEALWNEKTTYGQIYKRHEYWQAKYNFETATIDNLQTLFKTYEDEAQKQIEQGSYWGAYDNLLKMSHTFNLLDARGVVSSSDRVVKFGQMGKYSRQVGTLYLEDRKALGYPLRKHMAPVEYKPKQIWLKIDKGTKYQKNIAIVEIGMEELPADYLMKWKKQITHSWLRKQLKENKISYRKAYIYTTPRRIVMKIVQPSSKGTIKEKLFGPPAAIAYKDGKATKALEAFISRNGLNTSQVKIETKEEKEFIAATKISTLTLEEVLQNITNQIFELAPKTKWMMWNAGIPPFIRPLRSIVAFHNNKKLNISKMEVNSDKFTSVPRYEEPAIIKISSAQEYLKFIQDYGIILSIPKRIKRIKRSIAKHNSKPIGKFEEMIVKNAYMTENPHVATVQLEKRYLSLPEELITLILEKNLMYPITRDSKGNIWYHITANHYRVHKKIELGNQKTAISRLDDGVFYFNQDREQSLAEFGKDLENVVFHPKVGNYVEKKQRISDYTKTILSLMDKKENGTISEALKLLKNDKATALVGEFSSMEGVAGREYALRDGVAKEVAQVLSDHYLPEVGGEAPKDFESQIISLADKLDSLFELSKVEKLPTGSNDPFEIRRIVYKILQLLVKAELDIDLSSFFVEKEDLLNFIQVRFEQMLLEKGIEPWIANNVTYSTSVNFSKKWEFANELASAVKDEEQRDQILEVVKRVNNILNKNQKVVTAIDTKKLTPHKALDEYESKLFDFISKRLTFSAKDILELSNLLADLFENTMIMDKNEEVRNFRIGLLANTAKKLEKLYKV